MTKNPKLPPWAVYVAVVVVVATALILFAVDGSFERKELASGLFALFGTFAGALLAFRLEESRERSKEVKAQKAALNRALIVLGFQHNEVRNYRDLMAPHKSDIELAFNFPASQPPDQFDFRQKLDDLDFLLGSSNPQMLMDLAIEQERFDQAMQTIRQRNEFYVGQVQPVFAAKGLNNRAVTRGQLQEALGEFLFGGALQGADTMREHMDGSNESLPALAANLHALAKELYPDEKFVQFNLMPLANERAEQAAKAD